MSVDNKNLDLIKNYWENENTVSLKDGNLQSIERNAILDAVKTLPESSLDILFDIGCGDATDTIFFLEHFKKCYGYDYSKQMLEKAINNCKEKIIKFRNFDILNDDFNEKCTVAITKRCLINLGNFENQKKAILKIHNALNDNGYYLMLETCIDGLNNLNILRNKFNLESLKEPHHNTYFKLNNLLEFLKNYFEIQVMFNFSTYFFLTRVYNPALTADYMKYDTIAKEVYEKIDLFEGKNILSPQFLLILKKLVK
ncbi:MAG: hypothetical protein A2Y25_01625 [Candidatus Melainabacteria bacterium GWF2_37_15]|nr:MAG: hypothetical protein A2Y25_01625 [Candidatus Melainabacteria bacterium GWF2_37_15]